jgi:hypothetical protein
MISPDAIAPEIIVTAPMEKTARTVAMVETVATA